MNTNDNTIRVTENQQSGTVTISQKVPIRAGQVVVLLGAGASAPAGIPVTSSMMRLIEQRIESEKKSSEYDLPRLWSYLKRIIDVYAADDIVKDKLPLGIETLYDAIRSLRQLENSDLYPFIGALHPHLMILAGTRLNGIERLEELIKEIVVTETRSFKEQIDYVKGFQKMVEQEQVGLTIFTLNYDTVLEKGVDRERIESGFTEGDEWSWTNYSRHKYPVVEKEVISLYKLHGSSDWTLNAQGKIVRTANPEFTKTEILLGHSNKRRYEEYYIQPYIEFRHSVIKGAKVLFVIGYSFGDKHINDVITSLLEHNSEAKVVVVNKTSRKELEKLISELFGERHASERFEYSCDTSEGDARVYISQFNEKVRDYYARHFGNDPQRAPF